MRKFMIPALSLILLLSLAACEAHTPEPTAPKVQLANPYGTYETAEEMQEAAGLAVSLPAQLPDWVSQTIYRAIPGELVEVIYTDGSNEIRVRIKQGSENISGVYDMDAREETDVTVGENTVHLKGMTQEDGSFIVLVSTWTSAQGRTYSVTSPGGVAQAELIPILEAIQ